MIKGIESKYASLEKILDETLAYSDGLSESQLTQSQEGEWNTVQILHHLSTSEVGTVMYLQNKMKAHPDEIENGGIKSFIRGFMLTRALKSKSKKFKAPKVLKEVPDSPNYQKIKLRLKKNRELMEEVLNRFDDKMAKKAYFKHPVAGRINIYQTLDFLNAHFERHAMQIKARTKN